MRSDLNKVLESSLVPNVLRVSVNLPHEISTVPLFFISFKSALWLKLFAVFSLQHVFPAIVCQIDGDLVMISVFMYGNKIGLTEIVQVALTTHIDSELVVNCFPFQYFILLIFEIEYLQGSLFRSDENEMVVSGHAQSIEEVLDGEVVKCFFFITVVDGFLSCCKED